LTPSTTSHPPSLWDVNLNASEEQEELKEQDWPRSSTRLQVYTVRNGTFPTSTRAGVPNLKFVSSTILKLLAFNAPDFTGSRDHGHAPLYPLLTFGGWRPPSDIV